MEKIAERQGRPGLVDDHGRRRRARGPNSWKGKQTDKPLFVANYYPNVWQLAVTADSDVRKFTDLKGKAVAPPAARQHEPRRGLGAGS